MQHRRLFIKALAPILSIVLLSVSIILLRANLVPAGTICLVLALAGFIYGMRLLEKSPFTPEELEILRPLLPTLLVWLAVVGLSLLSVYYAADNFKSPETDRIADIAFAGSVALGLLAVWWQAIRVRDWHPVQWIKANRLETGLLVGILLLAFLLRTIDIRSHPYPWSGDEASIGMEAIRILKGEVTNFFDTGWSSQPNWSFVPTAVMELIFGKNIVAIRMASAVAGTLAVLFVYLFGREMFNPAIALLAGAFLATMPYHLHFSRVGVANIVDSLVSAAMFWLLARGINRDDARYYYTAGAVAGLSIYTYAGTRLVLVLAALTFLFLILRQRRYLPTHWKHLFAFAGGALISAVPQAAYFARHPDIFMGRFGQEGIFFNGWLASQVATTGRSMADILLSQFTRTTLVFIASAAPGNFFNSPEPYLTVIGSVLFLLGMAYAFAHLLEPRYFILLIWFWTVILFGGILTLNPPANTRLLMTTPAVALLLSVGAYQILEYLQKFSLIRPRLFTPVLTVLALVLMFQNVSYYMFTYRTQMLFQDANGEFAMEAGEMASSLGREYSVYVLGEPRLFSGFPTLAFLAPDNFRMDLGAGSLGSFAHAPGEKAAFFSIPEDRALLATVIEKYPGGEKGFVYRKPKPDEILFEYYILTH
jgi:4-amino-4-deoxy-L-arabinose transferase-like glycosyltransferase